MKLPPDYVIPSLGDLKRVVALMGDNQINTYKSELEMTEPQYLRYKELVWREDPIRFYNGMRITLAPKSGLEQEGERKHRGREKEPDLGKGESDDFHAGSVAREG